MPQKLPKIHVHDIAEISCWNYFRGSICLETRTEKLLFANIPFFLKNSLLIGSIFQDSSLETYL
jgi:hypothetical protein